MLLILMECFHKFDIFCWNNVQWWYEFLWRDLKIIASFYQFEIFQTPRNRKKNSFISHNFPIIYNFITIWNIFFKNFYHKTINKYLYTREESLNTSRISLLISYCYFYYTFELFQMQLILNLIIKITWMLIYTFGNNKKKMCI